MFPEDLDARGRYGFLVTLAAVQIVGRSYRSGRSEAVEVAAGLRLQFVELAVWCEACSGTDAGTFSQWFLEQVDGARTTPDWFSPEVVNLLLSLFCGSPQPPFDFVTDEAADMEMLAHPRRVAIYEMVYALLAGRARRVLAGGSVPTLPPFSRLASILEDIFRQSGDCRQAALNGALRFVFLSKDVADHDKPTMVQVVRDIRTAMKL